MSATSSTTASTIASIPATPTLEFLTSGCNRDPNAVHWLPLTTPLYPQGLVAYACANLVAIYDPAAEVVLATLRGHTKRVNAVQWMRQGSGSSGEPKPSADGTLELVSGGVDKQVLVWRFQPATRDYTLIGRLAGHEDGISAVSALHITHTTTAFTSYSLIASAAADLTVRIWLRSAAHPHLLQDGTTPLPVEAGGWQCLQVLSTGRHKIMHCVELTEIPLPASSSTTSSPSSILALSVGGVDSKIHLWLSDGSNVPALEFRSAVSLAGHENWIRSLEWTQMDRETTMMQSVSGSDASKEALSAPLISFMLASASQDKHIRLWKLQVGRHEGASVEEAASNTILCTSLGSRGHILTYRGFSFLLVLESVLSGHDNWVMCARWQPATYQTNDKGESSRHQPMCLVSASTDKSMNVWRPTRQGIWNNEVRVGEMGGHTLGFYGCAFSPQGDAILANGYSGSMHLWRRNSAQSEQWTPSITISGHAASVNDLCWDANGDYLLSTGSDQTTRLWAPWKAHILPTPTIADASSTSPTLIPRPSWHEISRPQLHGYDLNCICPLYDPQHIRAHALASGADEKVVRVFWAPLPFLDTVKLIAGVETVEATKTERPLLAPLMDETRTLEGGNGGGEDDEGEEMKLPSPPAAKGGNAEQLAFLESTASRAVKANLPELGLSNKALMDGDSANTLRGMSHVQQAVSAASSLSIDHPPPEDYLLSTTLWPEIEKLYGHGYEIISIACNYAGTLLASACVAKKSAHAVVRVWETNEWSEVLQLESHRSSVISLSFSPDDRFLLSASKDRHITVFEFQPKTTKPPVLLTSTKVKAHARIIWSASWAPLLGGDSYYFATGSRDKTVKCFRVLGGGSSPVQVIEDGILPTFASAVTAVAFAPLASRIASSDALFPHPAAIQPLTLAVGMEDGRIELWQTLTPFGEQKLAWKKLYAFPANVCHGGFVKKLVWRWRRMPDQDERNSELELASCSEDQSVRIFAVPATLVRPA